MGRSNQLSEREKGKLIAYSEINLSKRDMARRLRRLVHVEKSCQQKSKICLKELLAIPQTVVRH